MIKNKIKIIAALILLVLSAHVSYAGDGTKEFNVNGLKVIIKNTGKDVISVRLFIRGGTANYPIEKQGIEALSYNLAVKGGTVSMPKLDFSNQAEKMGTQFGSDASLDYGEMNMLCLKESWDKSWNLFADAVMNPAFDPTEFTNKKEQFVTYAKQNESNPDSKLEAIMFSTAFKGKDYEKDPQGTSESLSKLTLEDVRSYYSSNVCKEKAFLVVAGNVDENDIIEKVKATLSNLPEGTPVPNRETLKIEQPAHDIVNRKIATNYLSGIMSGIAWDSPDAIAMMVAMNIMQKKYFIELRSKRGLSYAPAAFIYGDAITNPFSEFYITTDHPKDAMQVMVDIINDVRKNGFTEDELKGSKDSYITTFFMRLETAANQSLNIGRWELRGNMSAFNDFAKMVNAVSLQDVNRVFTGNTGTIKWNYLGDETKVSPEDFKQIDKIGF